MRLDPVNAVSSFHYYMWNAWSEEECKITFGGAYKHFWDKWNSLASKSILGAAERFYAELSDNNRELLVNRAVALYDGKATREEPHDEDVYVCDACGSRKIEIQVWVNANTNEYLSDVDDDDTDWHIERLQAAYGRLVERPRLHYDGKHNRIARD